MATAATVTWAATGVVAPPRPQHHSLQPQRGGQRILLPSGWASGRRHGRRLLHVQAVSAFLKGKTPWWRVPKPPNMEEVRSIQQLVNKLDEYKDELVVVEMYAAWCAGCKALLPHLIQLAEADPSVHWIAVDYDENKPLGRGLGVTGLPTVLFFRGSEGLVESFQIKASQIQQLKDALERHSGPRQPCTAAAPLAAFPHVRPRHIAQQQQPQRLRVVALSAPPEDQQGTASASDSFSDGESGADNNSSSSSSDGSRRSPSGSKSSPGSRRQIIL